MHGVEYKINSLPARQLGSRHKVCITRDKHNLINITLQRQGGYIYANTHIHAFLANRRHNIFTLQVIKQTLPFQQSLDYSRPDRPLNIMA